MTHHSESLAKIMRFGKVDVRISVETHWPTWERSHSWKLRNTVVQFGLGTDDSFNLSDGFVIQGLDCASILPAVACGNEQLISYDDPTNLGFEGTFELGRILPAGFSALEVQSFLTEASYRTANI